MQNRKLFQWQTRKLDANWNSQHLSSMGKDKCSATYVKYKHEAQFSASQSESHQMFVGVERVSHRNFIGSEPVCRSNSESVRLWFRQFIQATRLNNQLRCQWVRADSDSGHCQLISSHRLSTEPAALWVSQRVCEQTEETWQRPSSVRPASVQVWTRAPLQHQRVFSSALKYERFYFAATMNMCLFVCLAATPVNGNPSGLTSQAVGKQTVKIYY